MTELPLHQQHRSRSPPPVQAMATDTVKYPSDQLEELQHAISISDRQRSFLSPRSGGLEGSTATKMTLVASNTSSDELTSRRRLSPGTTAEIDHEQGKDPEPERQTSILRTQSTPTTASGAAHNTINNDAAPTDLDASDVGSSIPQVQDITGGAMLSDEAKMLAKWKSRSGSHGIRERILKFTPSWFSVTMGTGVIGTLLLLMPWESTHDGLRYPAIVFTILASLQ